MSLPTIQAASNHRSLEHTCVMPFHTTVGDSLSLRELIKMGTQELVPSAKFHWMSSPSICVVGHDLYTTCTRDDSQSLNRAFSQLRIWNTARHTARNRKSTDTWSALLSATRKLVSLHAVHTQVNTNPINSITGKAAVIRRSRRT